MTYRSLPAILLAGIVATLIMDAANRLVALSGAIDVISLPLIGRVITAWLSGQFIFDSPALVPARAAEGTLGAVYHYSIGTAFAGLYWALRRGRAPTWLSACAFGVATSSVSLLVVFPAVGLGFLGSAVPSGRPLITSLMNHLFYGAGLFVGTSLALKFLQSTRVTNSVAAGQKH